MAAAFSKIRRTSETVEPALALLTALPTAWYSTQVGKIWAPITITRAPNVPRKSRPRKEMPRCLERVLIAFAMNPLLVEVVCQLNDPMRFRLPKFIQMKNAFPTMLRSGTNPQ